MWNIVMLGCRPDPPADLIKIVLERDIKGPKTAIDALAGEIPSRGDSHRLDDPHRGFASAPARREPAHKSSTKGAP